MASPAPPAAVVAPPAAVPAAAVDEQLYSRQLYVLGHAAQRRMMTSHAVLIGVSGLGAEVAKNVILAGLARVTLCDPTPPDSFDLGGNFYLSAGDLPQPGGAPVGRAALCRARLAELNEYVQVDVASGVTSLHDEAGLVGLVAGASVVVVTVPLATPLLRALDAACRQQNCCFVYALATGVFGTVFCDFGPAFRVHDVDGEAPATSQVEHVLTSDPAVVKVLEDGGRHGLATGDKVTFAKVQGLDGVLGQDVGTTHEVKVTGPFTFELPGVDASGCAEPATQGYITQVKTPATLSFKSYAEALADPGELMMSDFAKADRPPVLHLAYRALAAYAEAHGMELPRPGDAAAAREVWERAEALDAKGLLAGDPAVARRLVRHLAHGARAVLAPTCAALGGIVGQEVLKACSGKFTPVRGFFYFDADECLPADPPTDAVSGTSRYDSTVAVFGREAVQKLHDLNYFLVGAGAIGCEMLKNWALMGVACGEKGRVHITDMDRIERSNLSRQFLFRNKDINEFKSTAAANAARDMNGDMNVAPYTERVGNDTEHLFGDDFYDQLDGICTALDNVDARLYVDQRALFYRLPLLESGTLGTKGNTQVVVPRVTENYGATRDPPEKSIPVCTLKNFPNQIQHTLQWARDYFEGEFRQRGEDVNTYLSDPNWEHSKLETVLSMRQTLVDERPVSFEDCVVWARLKFETLFNNQIRQLLHNFPEDQVTASGTKFWSGSKRCPKPLAFDLHDACEDARMRNHFDFIVAAANLRAHMFGIKGRTDEAYFAEVLQNVIVPDYSPQEGVKIAANEAEAKESEAAEDATESDDLGDLLASLPKPGELAGFKLNPIEFDKDRDDHMRFVAACSNLRALNYAIPTADAHRSRAIAGRIIPAIATTTALVAGLVCLELYKLVGTPRRELAIDAYKNAFVNLAIPFMTLSEPSPPAATTALVKGKEWAWTAWDSLDMDVGDITLREFIEYFEKEYSVDVSMISHGVSILFSFFANKKKLAERMKMKMSEVVTSVAKKELPPNQLFLVLEIIANDLETDEEVELPYVKFRFR